MFRGSIDLNYTTPAPHKSVGQVIPRRVSLAGKRDTIRGRSKGRGTHERAGRTDSQDCCESSPLPPPTERGRGDFQEITMKSSTSPTQRTMTAMREAGYTCGVVEKWNMHAKIRQDLFGFIDIVAMRGDVIGVQATTMENKNARLNKIIAEPRARMWLLAGARIQLWSWRKLATKVNRKSWQADVMEITLAHFPVRRVSAGASPCGDGALIGGAE